MPKINDGKYEIECFWVGKEEHDKKDELEFKVKILGSNQADGMYIQLLRERELYIAFHVEERGVIKIGNCMVAAKKAWIGDGDTGDTIYCFVISYDDWLPTQQQQKEFNKKKLKMIVLDLSEFEQEEREQ